MAAATACAQLRAVVDEDHAVGGPGAGRRGGGAVAGGVGGPDAVVVGGRRRQAGVVEAGDVGGRRGDDREVDAVGRSARP